MIYFILGFLFAIYFCWSIIHVKRLHNKYLFFQGKKRAVNDKYYALRQFINDKFHVMTANNTIESYKQSQHYTELSKEDKKLFDDTATEFESVSKKYQDFTNKENKAYDKYDDATDSVLHTWFKWTSLAAGILFLIIGFFYGIVFTAIQMNWFESRYDLYTTTTVPLYDKDISSYNNELSDTQQFKRNHPLVSMFPKKIFDMKFVEKGDYESATTPYYYYYHNE